MKPEDKICYCYGVTMAKLWNYARRQKPRRPSQMSECLGAGTGCGWCIPILKQIQQEATAPSQDGIHIDMTPDEYAEKRKAYLQDKDKKNTF
jgi:bacterioferritin-associated ferredoxin